MTPTMEASMLMLAEILEAGTAESKAYARGELARIGRAIDRQQDPVDQGSGE